MAWGHEVNAESRRVFVLDCVGQISNQILQAPREFMRRTLPPTLKPSWVQHLLYCVLLYYSFKNFYSFILFIIMVVFTYLCII